MLTVITPATYTDLASLEDVKAELELSGAQDDAVLGRMIRQASADIVRYTNRSFGLETVREVFRIYEPYGELAYGAAAPPDWCFRGLEPLLLRRTPVVELISVIEDGTPVLPAEYELERDVGLLHRLSDGWRSGWWVPRVTVEYRAGYAAADLPEDVSRACVDLAKLRFFARSRDPALRSERILDVIDTSFTATSSAAIKRGLPVDVAERLDAYRRFES